MSKKESVFVSLPLADYNLMKQQNESWRDMSWRMNSIQSNARIFRSDITQKYECKPIKFSDVIEFIDLILET